MINISWLLGCFHTGTVLLCFQTDDLFRINVHVSLGLFCAHTALLQLMQAKACTFTVLSLQPYLAVPDVGHHNQKRWSLNLKTAIRNGTRPFLTCWHANLRCLLPGRTFSFKAICSGCWFGCVLTAETPLRISKGINLRQCNLGDLSLFVFVPQ